MIDPRDLSGGWDHALLGDAVQLGDGVFLERRQSFDRVSSRRVPALVLGDDVRIYTWTTFSIEDDAYVEVGNRSVLVGAHIMCAERITIGQDVVVSYNVTITDCDFHPMDPDLRRLDAIAVSATGDRSQRPPVDTRPVTIGDGARIGVGAILLKGVTIGDGAEIAAGAVVGRSVVPGGRVEGNPARPLGDRTGS